jgi:hypothetical protein
MKNKKALFPWMFPHLGVLPVNFLSHLSYLIDLFYLFDAFHRSLDRIDLGYMFLHIFLGLSWYQIHTSNSLDELLCLLKYSIGDLLFPSMSIQQ